MAQRLNDYLGIEKTVLEKLGCFNPILEVDSKYFIDPKNLINTTEKEFLDSSNKIRQRFDQIFQLLKASKQPQDYMWQNAFKLFPMGEVANLCIGYGFDNTGGRGIGPELATVTLENLKEFIDSGIDDPVLFELIGVFQKGVGCDLVSDLIAQLIIQDIEAYTTRIVLLLETQTTVNAENFGAMRSFRNPDNKKPLMLIPKSFLQPLPVAFDWDQIDRVCRENQEVRSRFAKLIGGSTWKKATKIDKDRLRNALISEPEATKDLLEAYKSKPKKNTYDFDSDPEGEYSWLEYSKRFSDENPLQLSRTNGDPGKVKNAVQKIIEQFTKLMEDNGLNTALYNEKTKKPMHERQAQHIFYGIADTYCLTNNMDISPETNSGKGPIDFKFSEGKKSKILVEIKLTKNPQIDHGLKVQLKEYENAEKPYASFLLVISVSHRFNYQKKLNREIAAMQARGEAMPTVCYVDATLKPSASKK